MRNLFTLLSGLFVLSVLGSALVGCTPRTEERTADVILLSRDGVTFSTEGGISTISVASASQWTPQSDKDWVKVTPAEKHLTIEVEKNPTSEIRKATITITSATDTKTVSVSQSFAETTVNLVVAAPDEISLDSEEDGLTISVTTNGEWDVASNATWLTVTPDFMRNTIDISAAANDGAESRPAKITVTSTLGGSTGTKEITVNQISDSENPYYKLLGDYGFWAEDWYFNGGALSIPGISTYCTIEQNEYRKSYYIKDLFTDGTVIEALFDKESGTISIPLNSSCLEVTYGVTNVTRFYLPRRINVSQKAFEGGVLSGVPGRADDDGGVERDAILLEGLNADYPQFGIVGVEDNNPSAYLYFSDLYYASGKMYLVRAERPVVPVAQAQKNIEPLFLFR